MSDLYICNECSRNESCDKAFKVNFDWFCDSTLPGVKKQQEDRFYSDHMNDFDFWVPQ